MRSNVLGEGGDCRLLSKNGGRRLCCHPAHYYARSIKVLYGSPQDRRGWFSRRLILTLCNHTRSRLRAHCIHLQGHHPRY